MTNPTPKTWFSCVMFADGQRIDTNKIIGSGIDGYVIRIREDTVMKIPRLTCRLFRDGTIVEDEENQYYRDTLVNEQQIYQRLDGIPGIAKCLNISANGITLKYYSKGSLEDYILHNPPPPWKQRLGWILQLIDIVLACHEKRVLWFDIALRNILLTDDCNGIVAIDFANGSILPFEETSTTTLLQDEQGYNERIEVLHVINVIYSIARWEKFQVDCVEDSEWPAKETFPPATTDSPLQHIISQVWLRQCSNLSDLRSDIVSSE